MSKPTPSDKRISLVTGGNRGIGYEAVKLLSQRIPEGIIILASRSVENGNAAVKKMKEESGDKPFDNIVVVELDISRKQSLDSAVAFVQERYGKLDDLVHNSAVAAVGGDGNSPEVLEINVTNAKDTVEAFWPLLLAAKKSHTNSNSNSPTSGPKIVVVSSEVGSWYSSSCGPSLQARLDDVEGNDWSKVEGMISEWVEFSKSHSDDTNSNADSNPTSSTWPIPNNPMAQAYCTSKALLNAWARSFAHHHPEIPFVLVCPGYCSTEINNYGGYRPASVGAESITWPLFNAFTSGKFYQDGQELPFTKPIPEDFFEMAAREKEKAMAGQ